MFAPAHWDPDLTCPLSSKSTPSLRLKELSASSSSSARLSTRSRTNDYADRTIRIALRDLLESIRKRPWHSLLVPSLRFQPPQNITAVREVSRTVDPIKKRDMRFTTRRLVILSVISPMGHSTASFLGHREVSFVQVIVTNATSNATLPDWY